MRPTHCVSSGRCSQRRKGLGHCLRQGHGALPLKARASLTGILASLYSLMPCVTCSLFPQSAYIQIALSSQPVNGVLPADKYTKAVQQLTRVPEEAYPDGGLFFITSCNFTQQELERRFTGAGA